MQGQLRVPRPIYKASRNLINNAISGAAGNARKQWGYYIPWLLVSTSITVMDITVSAFCITDLVVSIAMGRIPRHFAN